MRRRSSGGGSGLKRSLRLGLRGAVALCFALGTLGLPAASGQVPPGYYSSADGLTGPALRNALHAIIDDHTVIPLSGGAVDTHDAIDFLQQDPADSSRVILVYSGYSVPKSSWPDYNREHVWPVSLGPESGTVCHSDLFNIYGCDADVNATRGNTHYDECGGGCSIHPEAPLCRYDDDRWEPRDVEKGDLARALFYLDVRYSGDAPNEPDLQLQELSPSIGCDCMGIVSTLIEWHTMDPPDAAEMLRNHRIYSFYQGNRNPFVDHPEWVYEIFGGTPPPPPPPGGGEPWINEFHYDNSGADTAEGIEVAGPAGTSLSGWTLVGYNGSTSVVYETIPLSGVLPDQSNGYGALWFSFLGLQNGPDGIALVDAMGDVVEFIAYEGDFTATDGPAAGMVPILIGPSEDGGTQSNESLQRIGTGTAGGDFTWTGPSVASPGQLNSGQSFPTGGGPEFVRGDCNRDGSVGIGDALAMLDYLFSGGSVLCLEACDASDDDAVQINDPLSLLGYLFSGSPPPPVPFPDCGDDATRVGATDLGCDAYPCP